jgi:hypothetical protein
MGADPFTIMMIASAASSVVGGLAADKAGKVNQQVHNNNAMILRQGAKDALNRKAYEADLLRDRLAQEKAQNYVKYQKSGVEVAGSPIEVLGKMAGDMEFDAQMVKYEGTIQQYDLMQQAAVQEYQGRVARWKGKQEKTTGMVMAGISLAGAAYGALGGSTTPNASNRVVGNSRTYAGSLSSGQGIYE